MDCELVEKEDWKGDKVKVVSGGYEPGLPKGTVPWKENIESREEYLEYLKQSERYWYNDNDNWFGSEKRKNPA